MTPPEEPAAAAYLERMRAVRHRLETHAGQGLPSGLTDPDPGATERWEAGQVWAHLAEFPPYWARQIQIVVDGYRQSHSPVPFGRTKADAARIAAIERDRHVDPAALLERVRGAIAEAADRLERLPAGAWEAVGRHPTRGELPLSAIVEEFVVGHLEEHADQLDLLRDRG